MTTLNYTTPKTYNGLCDLFCDTLGGDEHKRARVGFALDHANDVRHLMKEEGSLKALEVCQRYVDGKATDSELRKVVRAADHAAHAVADYAAYIAAAAYVAHADCAAAAYGAAAGAVPAATKWTDPLPQKTLDRLEKWFPRKGL